METQFHGRRAVQVENDALRLTVTVGGGHVAEILHKGSGVNPLWIPPWPSMEPSQHDPAKHPEYGNDNESKLLSGIMGHNLCLDLFGPPSDAEFAAGISVHGEASVVDYHVEASGAEIVAKCAMPQAQLGFERRLRLGQKRVEFHETVENLSALDRPCGWTQHVTLGPPFLERGVTQFRAPGTKSRALGSPADFDWPYLPGTHEDLQVYTKAESSGGFTTHLMDPHREQAFFFAFSPVSKVLFGYVWKRADFPWLGIWEENHNRDHKPWNKRALTRGMEFGASPFPETRRQMIERREMFGVPGYRWIPAKSKVSVEYYAFLVPAAGIPDSLEQLAL
jgi:hypothetical protein